MKNKELISMVACTAVWLIALLVLATILTN